MQFFEFGSWRQGVERRHRGRLTDEIEAGASFFLEFEGYGAAGRFCCLSFP